MKRRLITIAVVVIFGVAGWIVYSVLHTLRGIPQAYAAWDTGTLVIEYMKQHDDHWPGSWDELLTVLDSEQGRQIPFRGAQAGDMAYARSLRETVSVDWNFDPAKPNAANPVSPIGGGKFSVVWQGAEPNEMMRGYLLKRASSQPTTGH